jgi:hypothetical protein
LICIKARRIAMWLAVSILRVEFNGTRNMSAYRVYCINGKHISAATPIECEDDAAARRQAAALLAKCTHSGAEVWERDRLVCRIDRANEASSGCGCSSSVAAPR